MAMILGRWVAVLRVQFPQLPGPGPGACAYMPPKQMSSALGARHNFASREGVFRVCTPGQLAAPIGMPRELPLRPAPPE